MGLLVLLCLGHFHCLISHLPVGFDFRFDGFFFLPFFLESHARRMRGVGRRKNMIKLYCMKKLNKKEKDIFIIKEDKAVVIN